MAIARFATQSQNPRPPRRHLARHVQPVVAAALGLALNVSAHAAIAPGINHLPPRLGGENGLVASQVVVSVSASATAPPPDNVGAPLAAVDGDILTSTDFSADPLSEAKEALASINGYSGLAKANAQVSSGSLHAFAGAQISRPELRGFATASATAIASFTDVIQVSPNGVSGLTADMKLTLNLDGQMGAFNPLFSGGSVTGRVWLFEFVQNVPLIPFVTGINSQYFESATLHTNPAIEGQNIKIGSLGLTPGRRYWLHAELQVDAHANWTTVFTPDLEERAIVDYSHTMRVFLDPSAEDPNVLYTTASGVDYLTPAPVPLPAAAWLLASAVVGLGFMRRRVAWSPTGD